MHGKSAAPTAVCFQLCKPEHTHAYAHANTHHLHSCVCLWVRGRCSKGLWQPSCVGQIRAQTERRVRGRKNTWNAHTPAHKQPSVTAQAERGWTWCPLTKCPVLALSLPVHINGSVKKKKRKKQQPGSELVHRYACVIQRSQSLAASHSCHLFTPPFHRLMWEAVKESWLKDKNSVRGFGIHSIQRVLISKALFDLVSLVHVQSYHMTCLHIQTHKHLIKCFTLHEESSYEILS